MKSGWYEDKHGTLIHYVNNKLHNEKGPAKIWSAGSEFWYQKFWYQDNKKHRMDGPAREYATGIKEWHYQDQYIDCSSQQEFERYLRLKSLW